MSNNLLLKWEGVELCADDAYQIMYKEGQNGMWVYCKSNTATAMYTIEGLHAETSYVFRVRVVNVISGVEGKFSIESDSITTGKSQALGMKQLSTLIYEKPIALYALPVTELKDARNTKAKTRKLTLGKSNLFHSILRYYVTVKNNKETMHTYECMHYGH
jgi:hypothetical protein